MSMYQEVSWHNTHFALLKKSELMGQNEQQQAEFFKLRGHQQLRGQHCTHF